MELLHKVENGERDKGICCDISSITLYIVFLHVLLLVWPQLAQ